MGKQYSVKAPYDNVILSVGGPSRRQGVPFILSDADAAALTTYDLTLLGSATTGLSDPAIAGAPVKAVNAQTGTAYTLQLSDVGKVVEVSNAAGITVTVPLNAAAAFPVGAEIEVQQTGVGQITIGSTGGVTVNNSKSATTRARWSVVRLRKRATDLWVLTGDLT